MRYLNIIVAVFSLMLVSCDRFDHDFTAVEETDFVTDFVEPLVLALDAASAADMSAIEAMYATDYLHNGVNRSERIEWMRSFWVQDEGATASISDVLIQQIDANNALMNWRLWIMGSDQSILADSLFIGERLVRRDGKWLFWGNQTCVQPSDRQLVIVEYFTFRTCPNCPPAEAELNNIRLQYPDNFIYLEHHTQMELMLPGDNTYQYYQAYSAPTAVFQGTEKVSGGLPEDTAQYQGIVDQLLTINKPISYSIDNLVYAGQDLSATVSLTPLIELPSEDLVLNYVLITDEVGYTNIAGEPLHNVVRAKGSVEISTSADLTDIPIQLSVAEGLPQNFKLVVFAQHKPQVFQNNATIYGGIIREISQNN
nr:hypothetical protein [Candidatus Cloacimonadota bacterium]